MDALEQLGYTKKVCFRRKDIDAGINDDGKTWSAGHRELTYTKEIYPWKDLPENNFYKSDVYHRTRTIEIHDDKTATVYGKFDAMELRACADVIEHFAECLREE